MERGHPTPRQTSGARWSKWRRDTKETPTPQTSQDAQVPADQCWRAEQCSLRGTTNPKPTCADDAGCPTAGQCSPTSGPSASPRAPLPSLAFCLGNCSCLHLPSPLTPQLRERPPGPVWALPVLQLGHPPGGQWKLLWAHFPHLPSYRAAFPVLPLVQHGNHRFPSVLHL